MFAVSAVHNLVAKHTERERDEKVRGQSSRWFLRKGLRCVGIGPGGLTR